MGDLVPAEELERLAMTHNLMGDERLCVLYLGRRLTEDGIKVQATIRGRRKVYLMRVVRVATTVDRIELDLSVHENTPQPRSTFSVPSTDVEKVRVEHRGQQQLLTCAVQCHGWERIQGRSFSFVGLSLDQRLSPTPSITKGLALALLLITSLPVEMSSSVRAFSCSFEIPVVRVTAEPPPPFNPAFGADPYPRSSPPPRRRSFVVEAPTDFASFLAPTGLGGLYERRFNDSGLECQDLPVMTREDLAELIGITDRLHQIKIMTQIRLQFSSPQAHPDSVATTEGAESPGSDAPRAAMAVAATEVRAYRASAIVEAVPIETGSHP